MPVIICIPQQTTGQKGTDNITLVCCFIFKSAPFLGNFWVLITLSPAWNAGATRGSGERHELVCKLLGWQHHRVSLEQLTLHLTECFISLLPWASTNPTRKIMKLDLTEEQNASEWNDLSICVTVRQYQGVREEGEQESVPKELCLLQSKRWCESWIHFLKEMDFWILLAGRWVLWRNSLHWLSLCSVSAQSPSNPLCVFVWGDSQGTLMLQLPWKPIQSGLSCHQK